MRSLGWSLSLLLLSVACASAPAPEPQIAPPPSVAVARVEPKASTTPKAPVPDRLTGELVRPVLTQMESAVRGCHALEYGGQQDGGGRIVIDWTISPGGEVQNVSITESSFGNPTFEGCVLEEAQGLKFPAAKNPTQLSKPYVVQQSESETAAAGL